MCLTHKSNTDRVDSGLVLVLTYIAVRICSRYATSRPYIALPSFTMLYVAINQMATFSLRYASSVCQIFHIHVHTLHSAVSYEPPYYISDIKGSQSSLYLLT